jgi:hypothetical protein
MVTDELIDVQERMIYFLINMYLFLVLKILLILVSHKVVDTIVIVDEEEILELTS